MTSKRVQTVLGDIDPMLLGRTLTHEHLSMEFNHFYRTPPKQLHSTLAEDQIKLETVGYLKQFPYSSQYNLVLNDDDSKKAVLNDVRAYKAFGGGTIVENSTTGLERDIDFCVNVSKDTGVHIVAGTGFYIEDVQRDNFLKYSEEDMYGHMLKEMTEGCVDYPSVKAGCIGEVASVWPIKDNERKAIRAAAQVQHEINCGVSFHPHRDPAAPFEIIRLYLEAGGKADKAVMSHLDRTLCVDETLLNFAELGTYCQYDLFGIEVSYYQLNESTDMPSDSQRLAKLKLLVDEGYEDRLLISHDIHTKHRLADFGGHGYSHILNSVIPRMGSKGFTQQVIDKITIQNPATWLAIS